MIPDIDFLTTNNTQKGREISENGSLDFLQQFDDFVRCFEVVLIVGVANLTLEGMKVGLKHDSHGYSDSKEDHKDFQDSSASLVNDVDLAASEADVLRLVDAREVEYDDSDQREK